jgi:hypothetical protein
MVDVVAIETNKTAARQPSSVLRQHVIDTAEESLLRLLGLKIEGEHSTWLYLPLVAGSLSVNR